MKQQTELARKRENEMSDLYAFSRRLAAAPSAADIYLAIEEYVANLVQRKVVLFGAAPTAIARSTPEQEGCRSACIRRSPRSSAGRTLGDHRRRQRRQHLVRPPRLATNARFRRHRHRSRQRAAEGGGGDPPAGRRRAVGRRRHARAARRRARAQRSQDALGDRAAARGADRLGVARTAHAAGVDPRRRDGADAIAGDRQGRAAERRSPAWCATRPSGSTTTSRTCSTPPASAAARSSRGMEWIEPQDIVNSALERRRRRLVQPQYRARHGLESAVDLCRSGAGGAGIRADRRQRGQVFARGLAHHDRRQAQRPRRDALRSATAAPG